MSGIDDYRRRIGRVFGPGVTPARPDPTARAGGEDGLGFLGYPSLAAVEFFLTAPVQREWERERRIRLPQRCCSCGREPEAYLDAEASVTGPGRGRTEGVLEHVPHCGEHAKAGRARLVVTVETWTPAVTRMVLTGEDRSFLAEAARLNRVGDSFPPWRAFPDYDSLTMGWREGNGEYWLDHSWEPFWRGLSEGDRDEYLDRWEAPEEWRERLSTGRAGGGARRSRPGTS